MESTRPVNLRLQFFPIKCVQNNSQVFHGVHIFVAIHIGKGMSVKEYLNDITEKEDRFELAHNNFIVYCARIEVVQPQYLYSPYIKTNLYPSIAGKMRKTSFVQVAMQQVRNSV